MWRKEELWPVVHRVRGTDEEARRRRVQEDEFVACFVSAGVEQLNDALGQPLIEGLAHEPSAAKEPGCRIRSLLSAERIVARINQDATYRRRVTRQQIRERREPYSRFVADVVSFAIYRRHWSLRTLDSTELESLTGDLDFAAAISRVAYSNLVESRKSDLRRLHFLAVAYAESDPVVGMALNDTYKLINERWEQVYKRVLRSRRLRLRDGVTVSDLTLILTAVDDGLAMRMFTDPEAPALGASPDENLLGLVARLLIVGCIDSGDGLAVNRAVNRAADVARGRRPPGSAAPQEDHT